MELYILCIDGKVKKILTEGIKWDNKVAQQK